MFQQERDVYKPKKNTIGRIISIIQCIKVNKGKFAPVVN
jgi:hypothetical protein